MDLDHNFYQVATDEELLYLKYVKIDCEGSLWELAQQIKEVNQN